MCERGAAFSARERAPSTALHFLFSKPASLSHRARKFLLPFGSCSSLTAGLLLESSDAFSAIEKSTLFLIVNLFCYLKITVYFTSEEINHTKKLLNFEIRLKKSVTERVSRPIKHGDTGLNTHACGRLACGW